PRLGPLRSLPSFPPRRSPDRGKTLACCATLCSDATIEADIDEDPDAEVIPVRDFAADIERIEPLTPTIKAIHLKLDKPIRFQPGDRKSTRLNSSHVKNSYAVF